MAENFFEHIFVFSSHEEFPVKAVELALIQSKGYEKPICFLSYLDKKIRASKEQIEEVHSRWTKKIQKDTQYPVVHYVLDSKEQFQEFMTAAEASMVLFQLSEHKGYDNVKTFLKMSRELRIPYVFVKPYFAPIDLGRVLVPVTFLIEDREKGPFSSGMGRFFNSKLLLMPAKDYGHKTQQNADAIKSLLEKFNLRYEYVEAKKDSFRVDLEAVKRAKDLNVGMLLMSASRDYGLDDIVFGPKELHCINQTSVPIMLINPRADLYVLCG